MDVPQVSPLHPLLQDLSRRHGAALHHDPLELLQVLPALRELLRTVLALLIESIFFGVAFWGSIQ